jgi:hypothetical protein
MAAPSPATTPVRVKNALPVAAVVVAVANSAVVAAPVVANVTNPF